MGKRRLPQQTERGDRTHETTMESTRRTRAASRATTVAEPGRGAMAAGSAEAQAPGREAVVMCATSGPMPVRAGDTLDMVLPLGDGCAFACPGPRVDDVDTRLAALGYAPGVAVLARVRLARDGVLHAGALAVRLGALPTPRHLIRALAPALAVAEIDRAHGGLLRAGPDTDDHGGLVDARGLGDVPGEALGALSRGLVRVVDGCAHPGVAAPRWTRPAKRLVLMRGDVLEVGIDLVEGAAALGRAGEVPAAEVRLVDALGPGHPPPGQAHLRFTVPSGENALCVDADALGALLGAPQIRARLAEGRASATAAWHEALARRIDAVTVGAVVRPAPAMTTRPHES